MSCLFQPMFLKKEESKRINKARSHGQAISWLQKILEENADADHKIVIRHVPVSDGSGSGVRVD